MRDEIWMASLSRWDVFGSGSGTVNNTRDWRLQCGGGGVDLRMGSGHGGQEKKSLINGH
jgi:hypothetical protein